MWSVDPTKTPPYLVRSPAACRRSYMAQKFWYPWKHETNTYAATLLPIRGVCLYYNMGIYKVVYGTYTTPALLSVRANFQVWKRLASFIPSLMACRGVHVDTACCLCAQHCGTTAELCIRWEKGGEGCSVRSLSNMGFTSHEFYPNPSLVPRLYLLAVKPGNEATQTLRTQDKSIGLIKWQNYTSN